jgi:hypothetical protein
VSDGEAERLAAKYSRLFKVPIVMVAIQMLEGDAAVSAPSRPELPTWRLSDLRDIRAQAGFTQR